MSCSPTCVQPSPTNAHCAATCHQTFGAVSAFDRHRRGGECIDTPTDSACTATAGASGATTWPRAPDGMAIPARPARHRASKPSRRYIGAPQHTPSPQNRPQAIR
jgi:hypothetical protein